MKRLGRKTRYLCLLFLCLAMIVLTMPVQGAAMIDDGPLNIGDVLSRVRPLSPISLLPWKQGKQAFSNSNEKLNSRSLRTPNVHERIKSHRSPATGSGKGVVRHKRTGPGVGCR